MTTAVWAKDTRTVGITLTSPFTAQQYEEAVARVRAVVEREGGADNATIRVSVRADRPQLVDVEASWQGFIAPSAEQHRVWLDDGAAFGRQRVIIERLRALADSLTTADKARVEDMIAWLQAIR